MSKILIIGGSGYLGGHLLKVLSNKHTVFFTSRVKSNESNRLEFDLEDLNTYQNVDFNNFELIVMLASSMYGIQSKTMENSCFELNCNAYKNLLNHFVEINYSNRLVYVSSMTVYSVNNTIPVDEKGCTETPPNPYGLSKSIAEQFTNFYCQNNNFKGLIIRIPGLFGGKRKGGFIYNAINKISRNEDFHITTDDLKYWECISVVDVSFMIEALLLNYNWQKQCEKFNISYGQETDIIEVALRIKKILHSKSKITFKEPKGYLPFYLSNKKYLTVSKNYSKNFNEALLTYIKSIS